MIDRLKSDLKAAMLKGDATSVSTLRMLISQFQYARIQAGRDLTDDDALGLMQRAVKTRRESIEQFEKGGRPELAAKEAAFKALTGSDEAKLIGWKEAEVRRGAEGPPVLHFTGRAALRSAELGVRRVFLTLSHTHETAGAVVILEA